MPGLLQKLQKPRHRMTPSEGVVLLDRPALEQESSSDSATIEVREPVEPGKFVRRRSGNTQSMQRPLADDDLPNWSIHPKKVQPRVERLVAAASEVMREKMDGQENVSRQVLASLLGQSLDEAVARVALPLPLSRKEQDVAEREIRHLLTELKPLDVLFEDAAVSQIYIDNHKTVKVLRKGQLLTTPFSFGSKEEYALFAAWLLRTHDRRLSSRDPIADVILEDRWRTHLNALDASVSDGDEPRLAFHIPRQQKLSFYDVLQAKILPATLAAWLSAVIESREVNILVAGPVGSGKTVMTTALLSGISSEERVITIERIPEIYIPGPNVEKLIARPAETAQHESVEISSLFQAALRRMPHRLVLGELQEEEGPLFLQAIESGFTGSLASVHAHSAEEGLWRFVDIVLSHGRTSEQSLVRRLSRAVHLVIAMGRSEDKPVLLDVVEVEPSNGGNFQLLPLVKFEGLVDGKRQWQLLRKHSRCIDLLAHQGKSLRPGVGLYSDQYPESMLGVKGKDVDLEK